MKGIFGILAALFLVLIAVASGLPRMATTDVPNGEPDILINSPTPPTDPFDDI